MNFRTLLIGIMVISLAAPVWAPPGPPPSGQPRDRTPEAQCISTQTKLNVIIPVFDPNIPDDPDDYPKQGIWPELRKAESIRFAANLRNTLEDTECFGDVRVTPNEYAMGELYVYGKILKSTSEEVHVKIRATDITNRSWMREQTFRYRVREYDLTSERKKSQDPYQPIWDNISVKIVRAVIRKMERDLQTIVRTGHVINAASYSSSEFEGFLRRPRSERGTIRLRNYPSNGDEAFTLANEMRVREELFNTQIQKKYTRFVTRSQEAYEKSQEAYEKFQEAEAEENYLENYLRVRVRQILDELARNINFTMTATNIYVEGQVVKIEGNLAQQMESWRSKLQGWYDQNRTPDIQLSLCDYDRGADRETAENRLMNVTPRINFPSFYYSVETHTMRNTRNIIRRKHEI